MEKQETEVKVREITVKYKTKYHFIEAYEQNSKYN